uniref:Uncharacterized protein n=1 Tax=Chromera velia CCMP2878 TaxID=1169474 RepID=A0A0G4GKE2_9ALVE|eukprot:Cvel_4826.t1-p1 / transcript=Cvel_4826.t1 / gene=Cvel_4826 / organism=Chromera_velia_CCMP2878 / gene_product=Ankyrin-3, putative / transcript_product=Ankyrin-3, putative / location=Cvel_scaffold217:73755-77718(-) / protein_length=1107 / sequence_SO=supercontig / SO=protein_coding / is_pseudo=false
MDSGVAFPTDDRCRTALHRAVAFNQSLDCLRLLIDYNLPLDAPDRDGLTALHLAARLQKGGAERVSLLLDGGASPDLEDLTGSTPLHYALLAGQAASVKLLLAAGADGGRFFEGGARREPEPLHQGTPVHLAVLVHDTACLNLLLEYGAPCNDLDLRGATALFRAVGLQKDAHCSSLIRAGASVHLHRPTDKSTPLHCAASVGSLSLVRMLLACGASPGVENIVGETPRDHVDAFRSRRVWDLLWKAEQMSGVRFRARVREREGGPFRLASLLHVPVALVQFRQALEGHRFRSQVREEPAFCRALFFLITPVVFTAIEKMVREGVKRRAEEAEKAREEAEVHRGEMLRKLKERKTTAEAEKEKDSMPPNAVVLRGDRKEGPEGVSSSSHRLPDPQGEEVVSFSGDGEGVSWIQGGTDRGREGEGGKEDGEEPKKKNDEEEENREKEMGLQKDREEETQGKETEEEKDEEKEDEEGSSDELPPPVRVRSSLNQTNSGGKDNPASFLKKGQGGSLDEKGRDETENKGDQKGEEENSGLQDAARAPENGAADEAEVPAEKPTDIFAFFGVQPPEKEHSKEADKKHDEGQQEERAKLLEKNGTTEMAEKEGDLDEKEKEKGKEKDPMDIVSFFSTSLPNPSESPNKNEEDCSEQKEKEENMSGEGEKKQAEDKRDGSEIKTEKKEGEKAPPAQTPSSATFFDAFGGLPVPQQKEEENEKTNEKGEEDAKDSPPPPAESKENSKDEEFPLQQNESAKNPPPPDDQEEEDNFSLPEAQTPSDVEVLEDTPSPNRTAHLQQQSPVRPSAAVEAETQDKEQTEKEHAAQENPLSSSSPQKPDVPFWTVFSSDPPTKALQEEGKKTENGSEKQQGQTDTSPDVPVSSPADPPNTAAGPEKEQEDKKEEDAAAPDESKVEEMEVEEFGSDFESPPAQSPSGSLKALIPLGPSMGGGLARQDSPVRHFSMSSFDSESGDEKIDVDEEGSERVKGTGPETSKSNNKQPSPVADIDPVRKGGAGEDSPSPSQSKEKIEVQQDAPVSDEKPFWAFFDTPSKNQNPSENETQNKKLDSLSAFLDSPSSSLGAIAGGEDGNLSASGRRRARPQSARRRPGRAT